MSPDVITAITTTVAILAFVVAFATYIRDGKNDMRDETREESENTGRILSRLDGIDAGIRDIKAENRLMRDEIKEVREIAQKAKSLAESAHSRLDRSGIDKH